MTAEHRASPVSLDQARARLPLLRAISIELKDRVEALQTLAGHEDDSARQAALNLRERVRECLSELEVLGVEVESFRPLTLVLPARDDTGGEQLLTWRYDDHDFQPLDEAEEA